MYLTFLPMTPCECVLLSSKVLSNYKDGKAPFDFTNATAMSLNYNQLRCKVTGSTIRPKCPKTTMEHTTQSDCVNDMTKMSLHYSPKAPNQCPHMTETSLNEHLEHDMPKRHERHGIMTELSLNKAQRLPDSLLGQIRCYI